MSEKNMLIRKIEVYLILADEGLRTMNERDVKQLRSSVESFILKFYGTGSHFYRHYRKIDRWKSIFNLNEIKGLLLAIKDDLEMEITIASKENIDPHHIEKNETLMNELTFIILECFYANQIFNWEAIENMIRNDSDYFNYTVREARTVYDKFIDKNIIVFSGLGDAYTITKEGKKLFERLSAERGGPVWESTQQKIIADNEEFFWDVFLCHASKDKPLIKAFIKELKKRKISYWFDEDMLKPGDIVIDKISEGLQKSKYIIPCISKDQLASGWCKGEYQSVLVTIIPLMNSPKSTQKVLPFIIDDTPDDLIPQFLKPFRRERMLNPDEYQRLLSFLKR